ncbi:hypothetical protein [Streptomyces gibsoniae]|uniref:Aldo/keto reductase n=1 Tax=Streptomyces gibsoniae TaxID=3075529 RepID=A0ABU2U8Q0_9ACTN|nr:hypothetical protein [Streptomyces sp. DSM 41699]MDT0469607.1 hypothetical protein [Streptomyces sp. DSM 41699]
MNTRPDLALNNGIGVPQLGFGVYPSPPMRTAAAVNVAANSGHRDIDTTGAH